MGHIPDGRAAVHSTTGFAAIPHSLLDALPSGNELLVYCAMARKPRATLDELAALAGLSRPTVQRCRASLMKKGAVERDEPANGRQHAAYRVVPLGEPRGGAR